MIKRKGLVDKKREKIDFTFDSVRARRRWELVEAIELLLIGHPSKKKSVNKKVLLLANKKLALRKYLMH